MMQEEAEKELVAKPKHVVWDIDTCEIPDGCNPSEIRWNIESALVKCYGPGPLTIVATGNLERVPRHVLETISRSGIMLSHSTIGSRGVVNKLFNTSDKYPAPAILMLIAEFRPVYDKCVVLFDSLGYTMARAYLSPQQESPKCTSCVWLWKSLLTPEEEEKTTRRRRRRKPELFEGKCNETAWKCMECYIDGRYVEGQGFEDFITHLHSEDHTLRDLLSLLPHSFFMNKDLVKKKSSHTVWSTGPSEKESIDFLKKQLVAGMLLPLVGEDALKKISQWREQRARGREEEEEEEEEECIAHRDNI